ncbi:ROK family protein [Photobacterium lutimaris]|uniref:Transcriptional regulator n=1 Tax=Photobacterium lutimaris TaxID=388278 RepID=A0A2T3IZ02_9GAMM|nr:ROK family protein [Photobacterium lutimaris]PSU33882.1 transcriptional regulator [Photobacterium lutimaris]TDR76206.1 N-acetylglucosamine kinase [Photobacterium lutimaris]
MLVGFDIGGTKIELQVLSDQGEVLFKLRQPTPGDYAAFLIKIREMLMDVENKIGFFGGIGIGLPGAICPTTGKMKNANCTFLNGRDVIGDLCQATGKTVRIANDANCFALSEAVDGAGGGGTVVFGAILGTGCGGGIVVNQSIITGANAITGEWGHNPLPGYNPETDGDIGQCYCGKKNCIEQYISGTGFAAQYNHKYQADLNSQQIMALVDAGNEQAVAAYQLMLDQMARSFASISNILDPDVIVLGGGMSNIERLYQDLPSAMNKYIFSNEPKVTVRRAVYGDSSGVRGAAWLAK